MAREGYTSGVITEIQRALMTRDVPEDDLETILNELEGYDLVEKEVKKNVKVKCAVPCCDNDIPSSIYPNRWSNLPTELVNTVMNTPLNSLSLLKATTVTTVCSEGEETMDPTIYEMKRARERLFSRLADSHSDKSEALQTKYKMVDDERPDTGEALITRIKDGKFIFDLEAEKAALKAGQSWQFGMFSFIKWRDPAQPADEVGFKVASEKLNVEYQNAVDELTVKTPQDGLATLRAFQAMTFN